MTRLRSIKASVLCALAVAGASAGAFLAPAKVSAACESNNCNWGGAYCQWNPWNQQSCNFYAPNKCETLNCS